jgi:hypothetical protein
MQHTWGPAAPFRTAMHARQLLVPDSGSSWFARTRQIVWSFLVQHART